MILIAGLEKRSATDPGIERAIDTFAAGLDDLRSDAIGPDS
jgi:hypothetical protein